MNNYPLLHLNALGRRSGGVVGSGSNGGRKGGSSHSLDCGSGASNRDHVGIATAVGNGST